MPKGQGDDLFNYILNLPITILNSFERSQFLILFQFFFFNSIIKSLLGYKLNLKQHIYVQ